MAKYSLYAIDSKITENTQIPQRQRSLSDIITVSKGSILSIYKDNENFA